MEDFQVDGNEFDASAHRGSNQVSLKAFNERLVINLIQQAGALSKAEIARVTKLSAQTVTIIVNRLIEEGYLLKRAARRGKVGQPSTPIELNPDGAISFGIKIGRRSVEVLSMSFDRKIIGRLSYTYEYPDPKLVFDSIKKGFEQLRAELTSTQHSRIIGIGVASPSGMEGWEGIVGAPNGALTDWEGIDIAAKVEGLVRYKAYWINDATAACLAEISLSTGIQWHSMLYLYLGTFVGGGLVLEGRLFEGRTGNAAAVGSIPLAMARQRDGIPMQLIEQASLNQLENAAISEEISMAEFSNGKPLSHKAHACFQKWADNASNALALSAIVGTAFIEVDNVVIDGGLSRELIEDVAAKTRTRMRDYNSEGIALPSIFAGKIGLNARALGGGFITHARKLCRRQ